MKYIEFDSSKKYDLILLGRIAVDLNPVDYYCPLNESTTFKRYLGGSPANIAVGLARLGKKCGFFARVSDDQLGTFVTDFFEKEGIDTSRVKRCENGEKIGLTFTEIKSETESSIVMYRNDAADLKLEVSDIDEEYIKQGKALLISGTALCESPSREAALKTQQRQGRRLRRWRLLREGLQRRHRRVRPGHGRKCRWCRCPRQFQSIRDLWNTADFLVRRA